MNLLFFPSFQRTMYESLLWARDFRFLMLCPEVLRSSPQLEISYRLSYPGIDLHSSISGSSIGMELLYPSGGIAKLYGVKPPKKHKYTLYNRIKF